MKNYLIKLIHRPWFALIVIMIGVAFSIGYTRDSVSTEATNRSNQVHAEAINYADQQRRELATAIQTVLQDSCQRGNGVRLIIRQLLAQEIPAIKQAVKEGRINQSQEAEIIAQVKSNIKLVSLTDCTALTSPIH